MFLDMITEIRGSVPKLPFDLAKKLVNRAWADVRRQNMWSFQLYDTSQWISPNLVNTGTVSVVQGSASVTLDATAAAALDAAVALQTFAPAIKRQFRIGAGTIYNIWGWDTATNILTLDRPYGESTSTAAAYQIYQCYYAAPYRDHLTWTSVRDMQNFTDLSIIHNRAQLDSSDPQRMWYAFPSAVVYYQQDQNPDSDTYQYPMYELWGGPQYSIVYQLYGIRRGADLAANTDVLPPAVGEDCLIELAKYYAYQWAEANKGAIPRNQGPDYKFLMGAAQVEYKRLYRDYRRRDMETVSNWFLIRKVSWFNGRYAHYNTISGTAFG